MADHLRVAFDLEVKQLAAGVEKDVTGLLSGLEDELQVVQEKDRSELMFAIYRGLDEFWNSEF